MGSNQDEDSMSINLENCSGDEFFKRIESKIRMEIPDSLKLIFKHCDIDTAVLFSRLDDKSIAEIEEFVRDELEQDMLPDNHNIDAYLGNYKKCKNKFKFAKGHKMILQLIADECANVIPINANRTNDGNGTTSNQAVKENTTLTANEKRHHYAELDPHAGVSRAERQSKKC